MLCDGEGVWVQLGQDVEGTVDLVDAGGVCVDEVDGGEEVGIEAAEQVV